MPAPDSKTKRASALRAFAKSASPAGIRGRVEFLPRPHPEERPAGPRLEGWEPVLLLPILRDAAWSLPRGYSRGAAPQDEVSFGSYRRSRAGQTRLFTVTAARYIGHWFATVVPPPGPAVPPAKLPAGKCQESRN